MGRLVLLSGPSCIGKGPLLEALRRFHPEQYAALSQLAVYNDRAPRPGEPDGQQYHFRPRHEVERLGASPGHLLVKARADLQAVELAAIQRILDAGRDAFFEGNPYIPEALREAGILGRVPSLTIFLSPLKREELLHLKAPQRRVDLPALVADVQRRKLLHRTALHKGALSLRDLEDVEKRAGCAYQELQQAWRYDYVIPLHDGEGNGNWDAFPYPIGSARQALAAFACLLAGGGAACPGVERWEEGLVP